MWKRLKRWIPALRSRKVRVAIVTVIAAVAAEYGLNVPTELLMTILTVGVSIILGIAHEDNGRNKAISNMWPNLGSSMNKPPAEPTPGSTQHGLSNKPPAETKS